MIQGWVGKLPDHSDDSYPDVLERVKSDYSGRLNGVAGNLKKHRPELLTSLADRRRTVESLQSDRDSHTNDLEEVRIRHAVGEFSEEQWDSRRAKIETSIDKVAAVLSVEEDAVAELATVVDSVDRIVGTVHPVPRISRVVEPVARKLETRPSKAANGAPAKSRSWSKVLSELPESDDQAEASEDELAFLETVSTDDFQKLDPINRAFLNGSN